MSTEHQRALFRQYQAKGDTLGWFEALYAEAGGDASKISWADLHANVPLVRWLERQKPDGKGKRVLDVGCGLGDNALVLQACGFDVTAFDISASAVKWAKRRFPEMRVDWQVADLLQAPEPWRGRFDLVVEVYTLQLLPAELRPQAMAMLAGFLKPGGDLLVICRGREDTDPPGQMPWPLTRREVEGFTALELRHISFEDFLDEETPPVRRFRALFRRD